MELKKISRKQIIEKKWDKTVFTSKNGLIYHLCFYLDAVSENWEAFVNDDYSIIIPVAFKKLPGYKNAYQPFFSRQQAILSTRNLSSSEEQEIIVFISSHYDKMHFCCNLLAETKKLDTKIKTDAWFYQELPIKEQKLLRENYKENAKRILKKSIGLVQEESLDVKSFIRFFRKEKGNEIKDLKNKDFSRLQDLLEQGIKHGYGKLFVVKSDSLLAYGYFWFYKDRIIYLKGSVNTEGKNKGAMYFLFDSVLNNYSNGFSVLDFGGSRIKSIADFFYKFGGADVYYSSITSGKTPFAYGILKKTKAALKK